MIPAMIRIITAAVALALAAPAAAAERRYMLTDFDRIQMEGPFRVTVSTGRPSAAGATGDPAALDRLTIEVVGRTLRIRPNRSAWGAGPVTAPLRINVSTHALRSASVTGSGALDIDKAKGLRFEATLSGSGRLTLGAVEADTLVVGAIGGGKLTIGGKAKMLRATIRGSADLDATDLRVEDADLKADTSGTIAFAAARSAKLVAGGAGDVTITGSPACTVTQTGAGLVSCGKPSR